MRSELMNEKMLFRLQHCDDAINGKINTLESLNEICKMVEEGADHTLDLLFLLSSYVKAKSMSHWFHGGDLKTFKNLCYNLLKMKYIASLPPYNSFSLSFLIDESVFYLLSDHEPLMDWFAKKVKESVPDEKKGNSLNFRYALAYLGEFDLLAEQAENILNAPVTKKTKPFLIDNQFFLALAKGDQEGMESAIRELVTPKKLNHRKEWDEGPYTQGLIGSSAIKYSKLARRHGYEINVDSPYIPKEWIPVEALDNYEDEFEFMKAYSI